MTMIEGIVGLIASVIAILGGLYLFARWMDKRFDTWVNTTVENTVAMKHLSDRVDHLEQWMRNGK